MCGVRLPVQVSRSSPRWRLLRLPRRSGTPTDALFDCVSPPRASQLRLTHCLSVSSAALFLPPTRSVSRDGARCLPTLPVCFCHRSTHYVSAGRATCTSMCLPLVSSKLGAPADCVSRALCMCNPFRGRLIAVPPRHASPLQRPRTPRTPRSQPCLPCVRALQLRVRINQDARVRFNQDARSQAACSSSRSLIQAARSYKPLAQTTQRPKEPPAPLQGDVVRIRLMRVQGDAFTQYAHCAHVLNSLRARLTQCRVSGICCVVSRVYI